MKRNSKLIQILNSKLRTLFSNPVEVYRKYMGKLKAKLVKLLGGIPPIYRENYDKHWNFTSFKDKVVLDLGADYGSTAYYFLRKGAKSVVAVEGNTDLASKLKQNFKKKNKVVAIEKFIDNPKTIEDLISQYHPELVKVDIEGAEKYLLEISNIEQVQEWLIEAHSEQINAALSKFLVQHKFQIHIFDYVNNCKIIYAHQK
ncbi:MAG: hypothetical protein ACUVTB_00650 [Candidatus Bathycorpusculaceae bacterium]